MIKPFYHFEPFIPQSAYVHAQAEIIGRVALGEHASVWPGAVLRADLNAITIGAYTNIQDNSVLHVDDSYPVVVGDYVVVGHAARLHGCSVGDGCLVGIGAIVLNGAIVEEECILAAGTLVAEKTVLRRGHLYMGVPAREKRPLTTDEITDVRRMAHKYVYMAEAHRRNEKALTQGKRLEKHDWESLLDDLSDHLSI